MSRPANRCAFDKSLQMLRQVRAQKEAAQPATEDDDNTTDPASSEICKLALSDRGRNAPSMAAEEAASTEDEKSVTTVGRGVEAASPRAVGDNDYSKERQEAA